MSGDVVAVPTVCNGYSSNVLCRLFKLFVLCVFSERS